LLPQLGLIALVADSHQQGILRVLLGQRGGALGTGVITHRVERHPRRDPGVYREAGPWLRSYQRDFRYAIVLLDSEWTGSPGPETIEEKIQVDLDRSGWVGRSRVIVIAPELESWAWCEGPQVTRVLGCSWARIRQLGRQWAWWPEGHAKPTRPKELLEGVLRQTGRKPSVALYRELASEVALDRCQDPAFCRLRDTLREWFPAGTP
jgi:hypothetical protein